MKRTAPTMMDEYNQYKLMLTKAAWNFVRATGVEFDEAMSISNLAFFEARRTYDSGQSGFCTHLWHTISGYFKNEMRDHIEILQTEVKSRIPGEIDTVDSNYHQYEKEIESMIVEMCKDQLSSREIPFREWIMSLSDKARLLIMLIIADPCDFIGITMVALSKTLNHQLGWTWETSRSVISEIKSELGIAF